MDPWDGTAIDQKRKWRQCPPSLAKEQMESRNNEQGLSPRSGCAACRCLLYTSPAICGTPFSGIRLPHRMMSDFSIRGNAMQIHLAGKSGLNRYTVTYSFYSACMEYFGTKLCLCFIPQTSPGRPIICTVHIIFLVQIPRYSRFENTSAPRV